MEKRKLFMIEELLERYFEGETSTAEEKRIRAFFASGEVPEHLKAYIPLFACFDEEIERNAEARGGKPRRRAVLYLFSGVAACVLVLLSLGRLLYPAETRFCSDNYVVINGQCYSDIHKIRSLALEALQEVATPAGDYFPEMEKEESDRRMFENQLKELGDFLNEDD